MDEQNLIKKIQILKQVKPNKIWVSFAKKEMLSRISEEEPSFDWRRVRIGNIFSLPVLKPVAITLAVLIFFSVLGGTFLVVKNALPGQSVYSVKLIYQTLRTRFVAMEQKPQAHLEYAYQRIEDLRKVEEEKREEGVNETAKILADDFSKATTSFKDIKEPAKKFAAGANLVKQVSKIEKSLTEEKENLSAVSQEKISEVEKMAKETKTEVLTSLIKDSENDSDYRQKVEELQREIQDYENQYKQSQENLSK